MKLLKGRHILVVEDEFLIAASIEIALEEAGAVTVGPFSRCADALNRLNGADVDAAILDFMLSGETSESVASMLRQRAIPFVISTGHSDDRRVSALGGTVTLNKPYAPHALVQALAQAITKAA